MKLRFNTYLVLIPVFWMFSYQRTFAQCPTIDYALINSCAPSSSGTEGINEFVVFTTTANATASAYTLYYNNATPVDNSPLNILAGSNARTKNGIGTISANNCSASLNFVTSPSTPIPSGSKVVFIPSDFDQNYDFSILCSGVGIYIVYIDINASAPTPQWSSVGSFANSPNSDRYLQITNGATSCISNIRSYINGWASNTDGNFVSWNSSGVASYGNSGCTFSLLPTITPGIIPDLCSGSTTATMPYTVTENPDKYSIIWNATALASGFTNVVDANLTTSPLSIGVSGTAIANTYSASLTVTNTTTGLSSSPQNISVKINALPTITNTAPNNRCGTGTVTLGATASSGTINWYAAATGGISIGSGTSFTTPSISMTTTYWVDATLGTCISSPRKSVLATVNTSGSIPTPTVVSPVEYCLNSIPVALTATPLPGATLNWYGTNSTGGTASIVAPIPSTAIVASTPYYVSQTVGTCESPRVPIVVNVLANSSGAINIFCDPSQVTTTTSVFFDWNNPPGFSPKFNYTYSINGGPLVSGISNISHQEVFGVAPGQSVTFTIVSVVGLPCIPKASATCSAKCATTTTPNFPVISPICSGSTAPILALTSPNGITGTWSPAIVNTTISGSYKFTPDPILFPCATTQTLGVTVNAKVTPTFAAIPTTICQNATAPILPTSSTNSPAIIGTWSPVIINTSVLAKTTYTFTPTAGSCASSTSIDITVNQTVNPTFSSVPTICSGATLSALPTTSNNGITGSWLPALDNTKTTTYTFTPTSGQCANTTTLIITVNPTTVPTFNSVAPICSGAILSPLPLTSTNGIAGTWSPILDNTTTTTYTFTPTSALCASNANLTIIVNPQVVPTFASISPICSGSLLTPLPTTSLNGVKGTWLPALNNTLTTTYTFTPIAGSCSTTITLTIVVNTIVTPIFNPIGSLCSGTLITLPTTSINSIIGTWSPAYNPTKSTTYTFKPNTGQCAVSTTLQTTIIPLPVATATPTSSSICSGGTTAISLSSSIVGSTFDWNVVQTNVTGAIAGSISTISQTLTTVGNKPGEAIYSITPTANGCPGLPVLSVLTVNPIPVASANPSLETICSGTATNIALTSTVAGTTYSWTVVQAGIVGAISGSGNTIVQTLKSVGTFQGSANYTITPNANGCQGNPISVTIIVNPTPEVYGAGGTTICSGDFTDIVLTSNILGTDFTWTAVQTDVIGASNGSGNAINQILQAESKLGTAEYAIIPTLNSCDGNAIKITISVNPLPEPILENGIICIEQSTGNTLQSYILDSGLSNSSYDFKWFLDAVEISGAIANTYEAFVDGVYSVQATNKLSGCISKLSFATVEKNYPADSFTTVVSEAFATNPTVTVTVQGGTGPFLYQIDGGALQKSNVFSGVGNGTHLITVQDDQGCTRITQEIKVIDYPKFFSPNGDGANDTWNISGLKDQDDAEIFIFDRYGKLIKQIFTAGEGWDGSLNGHELPSTDYWFTVDYTENNIKKLFKAHFSLRR